MSGHKTGRGDMGDVRRCHMTSGTLEKGFSVNQFPSKRTGMETAGVLGKVISHMRENVNNMDYSGIYKSQGHYETRSLRA